jgi:predicted AAA+ superfamily ATPase
LQLLALQIGSEISYSEIGQKLGLNVATVQRYISLLEKTFVIFQLRGFSRNLRKEITKSVKIYFWDLGIRNSLIKNFNELAVRNDTGALWENFCIVERLKNNNNHQRFVNSYFWRTYDQKEIDYLEEEGGKLSAFEFKWGSDKKIKPPKEFLDTYVGSQFKVINRDNFDEF